MATDNPLTTKWSGPYGGAPPFAKVKVEYFAPAFAIAMDRQRRELAAIAADPSPPTFDNTIIALEKSGEILDRTSTVFFSPRP